MSTLVTLYLSIASAAGAQVIVLDLKPISVEEADVRVLDGLLSEQIGQHISRWPRGARPSVVTGDDLRTLITLEANQAAAGCDNASCLSDIAQMLGARFVITGSVGRLGSETVLQLWLFDVEKATTVARSSAEGKDASSLRAALPRVVADVIAPLEPRARSVGVDPLAVGGATIAGVGVVVAGSAGALALLLDQQLAATSEASQSEKRQALDLGPALVATSAIAGGVAAVGVALVAVAAAGGDS